MAGHDESHDREPGMESMEVPRDVSAESSHLGPDLGSFLGASRSIREQDSMASPLNEELMSARR